VLILAWLSPKTIALQLEVEIAELVVGGSARVACKPLGQPERGLLVGFNEFLPGGWHGA
jgi:hypothetical protein